MRGRYRQILEALLASVKRRFGQERIEDLKVELVGPIREATDRELIVQLIAREKWWSRILLLSIYPKLVLPYLIRIRRSEVQTPFFGRPRPKNGFFVCFCKSETKTHFWVAPSSRFWHRRLFAGTSLEKCQNSLLGCIFQPDVLISNHYAVNQKTTRD